MQVEQFDNGYALWLEPAHLHFHHGDSARVKVLWGYAMKREKLDKPLNWTGLVVDPGGREYGAPISKDRDGFNYELAFEGGPEGIYTVQVEHHTGKLQVPDGDGIEFHHLARVLVPFGHHVHGTGISLGRGLEIVPGEYGEYHPGDMIKLTVLLNGKPQAGVRVLATYHIYDGEGFCHEFNTGLDGYSEFIFDARGHWMFQVFKSEGKDRYISTLVVPGVR